MHGGTDDDNKGTFGWPLSSWFVGVARAEAVRWTDESTSELSFQVSTAVWHCNMRISSGLQCPTAVLPNL